MKNKRSATAVNYHLFEPCNMQCKYCFAQFKDVKRILPKGYLPKEDSIQIINQIADAGFSKITFVGGEPTLCKWLPELIKHSKEKGLTTMVVTNGSLINEEWLQKTSSYLDWVGISIDSLNNDNNIKIGRYSAGKKVMRKEQYFKLFSLLKQYKIKAKINTVVTKYSYREDFSELINQAEPKRWKIFEPLAVEGQNDGKIEEVKPTNQQFNQFVKFHKSSVLNKDLIVSESNEEMTGSYLMIDPAGRFFDNTKGKHTYSDPILKVGLQEASKQVNFNYKQYLNRGGEYEW